MNLNKFLAGYITCALWSSTDEHGEPLDAVFGRDDLSTNALEQMREDCADFIDANRADLADYDFQMASRGVNDPEGSAGHDFWLTRNGHGAGFWDRGLGDLGDRLTAAAKVYGSADLYAGDDGYIYGA